MQRTAASQRGAVGTGDVHDGGDLGEAAAHGVGDELIGGAEREHQAEAGAAGARRRARALRIEELGERAFDVAARERAEAVDDADDEVAAVAAVVQAHLLPSGASATGVRRSRPACTAAPPASRGAS